MNDNQYPNQQGFNQQGNPYQGNQYQGYPQQGYPQQQYQVYPNSGYPDYNQGYPPQSSSEANKGVSAGKIILIVLGCILGFIALILAITIPLYISIKKKTKAAMEEFQSTYSNFDFTSTDYSSEELQETMKELGELAEQLESIDDDESYQELMETLEKLENIEDIEDLDDLDLSDLDLDDSSDDSTGKSTSSDEVVFTKDYFASKKWEGLYVETDPDPNKALIIPETDNTFIWYRDKDDLDGDYYSGSYELYIGDEAVTYLTTESDIKGNVTEQDIIDMENPEYGATRENFVCIVLTNEKECFYGKETTYEPEDQMTSNLYGYFVNDKDGYKLTLIIYGNPYEFNLIPKDKD